MAENALGGPYVDANTKAWPNPASYMGLCVGTTPIDVCQQVSNTYIAADPSDTTNTKNLPQDSYFAFQSESMFYGTQFPATSSPYQQITFRLEYLDANGQWKPYDEKYPDFHQTGHPKIAVNTNEPAWANSKWANPSPDYGAQMNSFGGVIDPRTARFGVGTTCTTNNTYVLETDASSHYGINDDTDNVAFGQSRYTVFGTQRPDGYLSQYTKYSNPGMSSDPGRNIQMRWFSGIGYANTVAQGDVTPSEWDGLFAQNNPAITVPTANNNGMVHFYYEDPDGIARRAMGAYADTTTTVHTGGQLPPTTATYFGLPEYTANLYPTGSLGVGTPRVTTLNRPMILNRAFQSVGEMSYAFRGTPWKQIDFFTPESGDVALLDVFCVNELPTSGMVAGKINLNTHQTPVLQAILTGACRDEDKNTVGLPNTTTFSYPLAGLDSIEASAIANQLCSITTDTTHAWRGPLSNVSQLVGRYVANPGDTSSAAANPDYYTYTEPFSNITYTYAGLSAALSQVNANTTVPNAKLMTPRVQRMREAPIRALADSGQTRVWNLMIDVVAQTGRYAANASSLSQFVVEGEQRCWVHVAIDRTTGDVIDKQLEVVTE